MHLALVNLYDMQRKLYPVQLAFQLHAVPSSAQELIIEQATQGQVHNLISHHGNVPPASDIALQTTWLYICPSQNVVCCRDQTLTVSRAAQTVVLSKTRPPATLPTALTAPTMLT